MKLAGLLLFALSASAFAGELPPEPYANSQHLHQAESHTFELTPNLAGVTESFHQGSASAGANGYSARLMGEYAFTEMYSLAAKAGYSEFREQSLGCTTNCVNSKATGMNNSDLLGKFKVDLGPGTFKAILDFNFSLDRSTKDANGNSNNYSGGDLVNLKAAYELDLGETLIGIDAAYDIWKQDRAFSNSGETGTRTGAATWSAELFYETKYRVFTFGGYAKYLHGASGGGSTDDGLQIVQSYQYDEGIFGLYAPVVVGGTITLFPQLNYQHTNQAFGSIDGFDLDFAARFVF